MVLIKKLWNDNPAFTLVLRWALMSAAIFWAFVFRVGAHAPGLPEFVYVNF
jgi:hypothetical protein